MFNEKKEEMGLPVWQSPKYEESKKKALEIINSGKYGVNEGDFWILMNKTRDGKKMAYTGLIISHNGCLKINDSIENKVNPNKFTLDKEGYGGSLVYTYCDDDVYEVGEVTALNCKNSYPYAMAYKRCFDRAVLKKSKLAFSGIYSEVEADEFKEPVEETKTEVNNQEPKLATKSDKATIKKTYGDKLPKLLEGLGLKDLEEMTYDQAKDILKKLEEASQKKAMEDFSKGATKEELERGFY